jgi:hypothetical protein
MLQEYDELLEFCPESLVCFFFPFFAWRIEVSGKFAFHN